MVWWTYQKIFQAVLAKEHCPKNAFAKGWTSYETDPRFFNPDSSRSCYTFWNILWDCDSRPDKGGHGVFYCIYRKRSCQQPPQGWRPSGIVLETKNKHSKALSDKLAYLTRTEDGRILKSSTMYIRGEDDEIQYIFSINYDITGLISIDNALRSLIETSPTENKGAEKNHPQCQWSSGWTDWAVRSHCRQACGSDDKGWKISAIQFLNDSGAFLVTKSGDKVSSYFGISKFTLYSYIDAAKKNSEAP